MSQEFFDQYRHAQVARRQASDRYLALLEESRERSLSAEERKELSRLREAARGDRQVLGNW